MAELGRKGGQARGRRNEQQASDKLEGLAHAAIEELLTNAGGSATARAAAARLVLDKVAASSPYSTELAKRAAAAEMQAQRETELPFARERLARLIEGKAKELADAMTEEQIAERVERRAEERAAELYAERMRLETEARAGRVGRVEGPIAFPL